MISRSPDQVELTSNVDLLRVLETKLASPGRRNSLPSGFLTPMSGAVSSRPSSLANSPIPEPEPWSYERGLFDDSNLSLIDDF